jgi:hypothetical protein
MLGSAANLNSRLHCGIAAAGHNGCWLVGRDGGLRLRAGRDLPWLCRRPHPAQADRCGRLRVLSQGILAGRDGGVFGCGPEAGYVGFGVDPPERPGRGASLPIPNWLHGTRVWRVAPLTCGGSLLTREFGLVSGFREHASVFGVFPKGRPECSGKSSGPRPVRASNSIGDFLMGPLGRPNDVIRVRPKPEGAGSV